MTSTPHSRNFARALSSHGSLLRSLTEGLALACLVFLLEYAMDYVGFFNSHGQAIWWPTNGLALALLIRSDRSRWPAILAGVLMGSWAGTLIHGYPISSWIVNATANSVGPLFGALMLPRFEKLENWLQQPHLVIRFVAFALLLAPALSATIYASNVHRFMPGLDYWTVLQTRGDSDMLGYAMFAPLVLVLSSRETYRLASISDLAMPVFLLGVVAGTTYCVFWQFSYSLTFVLVSVILLVSLRLGFAASVIAVNLLAVLATTATMHGHGPLTMGTGDVLEHRILLLQGFLSLTMVTAFSVSVIQIEREVFQQKLLLAYKEMETLATTDALTGLANRRLFEESLKADWARALRSGDSLALLMIDVDHFKSYNDRFGHPAGDICLHAIAQSIVTMAHRSTDLLARYGGEEFLFLLPTATLEDAARLAETIRLRIESLHEHTEKTIHCPVTVSVGCAAMTPAPGLAPNSLIAASDEALYRAKRNGRNRVELAEVSAVPFDLNTVL
ncbi:sensor domain-containing diguanylate cyclase [Acidicapsa acidisoli]|uniref:sensor domain-containing diguanylate cyclase n=1 Tax=Acidicapsa acidisoli TaxID=1615681 RepID=UPI0021DFCC9F|nr:diguanylate cyclase [Acidicapsa acidisoli]